MTPAPIDRPLSRAYLRKFLGWSTAYPPTLSDPASLRIMENAMIHRDGAVGPRPGLRPFITVKSVGYHPSINAKLVSVPEPFYGADGSKQYAVAGRWTNESGDIVTFYIGRAGLTETHIAPYSLDFFTVAGFAGELGGDPDIVYTSDVTYVKFLQIDNKIITLSDNAQPARILEVGKKKEVRTPKALGGQSLGHREDEDFTAWDWYDAPMVYQPKVSVRFPTQYVDHTESVTPSEAESTLLYAKTAAGEADSATHFMGFFYTFSNEFGEGLPSPVLRVPVRRAWSQWRWGSWATPWPGPDPSYHELVGVDPTFSEDQIMVRIPLSAARQAVQRNATHCHVYAMYWNSQQPMPVEATRVKTTEMSVMNYHDLMTMDSGNWEHNRLWARVTPASIVGIGGVYTPPPMHDYQKYVEGLKDYSTPPASSQGIIAADRMILVNDPTAGAVVKWSGNQQGAYTDLGPAAGGGYKTLTSGNLQIPACVKLWQNPQSADTLTVLCLGTDGMSSTYYMAPAQIAAQSEATNIMAFEETTATQGTSSPYGCEVFNNALYHPIDTELTKSTASNYNVNHKAQTDQIANGWTRLIDKYWIMSSELDGRLYYLVNNPDGEWLRDGWKGNEIWVLDAGTEKGMWSRWLVGGLSLKRVEYDGRVYMSVTRPEGVYYFDPHTEFDHLIEMTPPETWPEIFDPSWNDPENSLLTVDPKPFLWHIETNTQGANRAHDAWAHLQKVTVSFGNFKGAVRWGIRGTDLHGRSVNISKIYQDFNPLNPEQDLTSNIEDVLQVKRDMKEWVFYSHTVTNNDVEPAEHEPMFGQINSVMYSYTPVSVNVGYEHGSVETFEYGHATAQWGVGTTDAGVPMPYTDTSRDFGSYMGLVV